MSQPQCKASRRVRKDRKVLISKYLYFAHFVFSLRTLREKEVETQP